MPRAKFEIERKCLCCGKPFMALTITSRYCSNACIKKASRMRKMEEKKEAVLREVAGQVDDSRDYISVKEAISLYAVSRTSLYHYIRTGQIPSVNLGAHLTRVSRKELDMLFHPRQDLLDGKVKPMRKLYDMEPENCYTITEICKKYKVNDSTVYTQIRKYGIPTRQIGNYVYVPKSEIDNLYKHGKV